MGYKVDVPEPQKQVLRNLPLSRERKIKTWKYINIYIRTVSDAFRNDPSNRVPGAPLFQMQYVFRDDHGDGQIHVVDFRIDDSAAVYGVLRIDSVDFQ